MSEMKKNPTPSDKNQVPAPKQAKDPILAGHESDDASQKQDKQESKGKPLAVIETKAVRAQDLDMGSPEQKQMNNNEIEPPKRIIRQGLAVILLFFGALGIWAYFGHISGAVVAPGKVKIESERKTVQHLEGGIVDSILIKEGESVVEGQPLIVLESVQIDANTSALQKQLVSLLAQQVRLTTEKKLGESFTWSEDLMELAKKYDNTDALTNELNNFTARREALSAQIGLLNTQLAQLKAQVAGFQDQLKAEQIIIGTLYEELQAKRQLLKERYLEKSQVLELERNLATHVGERGRLRQAIAESNQRSAELNLRIEDLKVRFIEEATTNLANVENDIAQTNEKLRPLKDAKKRLQIVAPVSGKVVDLKVHSKGGVVRSGEPLMDIVPHDNPLIIETQVPVNKITEVYIGQDALVQLDAFDTRLIPHVKAKVTYISADRLEEQTSAGPQPYYMCYVEIDPKDLDANDVYLSPGMPATVFITTREKTVLYYMMEPLIKSWDRALRE